MTWLGLSDGFWGALFGALISGVIASLIMKKQINYDQKRNEIESLQQYIKSSLLLIKNCQKIIKESKDFGELIIEYDEVMQNKENYSEAEIDNAEINIEWAKKSYDQIKRSLKEISGINHECIIEESYQIFLDIIEVCIDEIDYNCKRYFQEICIGFGPTYIMYAEQLEDLIKVYSIVLDEKKMYLEEIK